MLYSFWRAFTVFFVELILAGAPENSGELFSPRVHDKELKPDQHKQEEKKPALFPLKHIGCLQFRFFISEPIFGSDVAILSGILREKKKKLKP